MDKRRRAGRVDPVCWSTPQYLHHLKNGIHAGIRGGKCADMEAGRVFFPWNRAGLEGRLANLQQLPAVAVEMRWFYPILASLKSVKTDIGISGGLKTAELFLQHSTRPINQSAFFNFPGRMKRSSFVARTTPSGSDPTYALAGDRFSRFTLALLTNARGGQMSA